MRDEKVVVIDSGHGGMDPGKVGEEGVYEKDINLAIAKELETILKGKGYKVVMTRTEDAGLYKETDKSKKMEDLKNRVACIEEANPDFAISIHQNSFTVPTVRGAQVFYHKESEEGKKYAETLQKALKENLDSENNRVAKGNMNYYLLQKTKAPLVIVECGFLSCPEEMKLLASKEYQKKVADSLAIGIETCISSSTMVK